MYFVDVNMFVSRNWTLIVKASNVSVDNKLNLTKQSLIIYYRIVIMLICLRFYQGPWFVNPNSSKSGRKKRINDY